MTLLQQFSYSPRHPFLPRPIGGLFSLGELSRDILPFIYAVRELSKRTISRTEARARNLFPVWISLSVSAEVLRETPRSPIHPTAMDPWWKKRGNGARKRRGRHSLGNPKRFTAHYSSAAVVSDWIRSIVVRGDNTRGFRERWYRGKLDSCFRVKARFN